MVGLLDTALTDLLIQDLTKFASHTRLEAHDEGNAYTTVQLWLGSHVYGHSPRPRPMHLFSTCIEDADIMIRHSCGYISIPQGLEMGSRGWTWWIIHTG